MKRHHNTCADCDEFPCDKFNKWFDTDSFVTHQNCLPNIGTIKKSGMKAFLKEQAERKELLEIMLEKYNPGRCMSLYCLASALVSIESLKTALKQMDYVKENRSKAFKAAIQELAKKEKISLNLRR